MIAATSRTFLPLVFEGAADERRSERADVRALMREDEILAAGLADQTGVAAVIFNVIADQLPDFTEDFGRTGEMEARQIRIRQNIF